MSFKILLIYTALLYVEKLFCIGSRYHVIFPHGCNNYININYATVFFPPKSQIGQKVMNRFFFFNNSTTKCIVNKENKYNRCICVQRIMIDMIKTSLSRC